MEKKYIDVEHFNEDLLRSIAKNNRSDLIELARGIVELLDLEPAADVAPVVHGDWIPTTKHKWETDENGKIKEWSWYHEFHNGPTCVICGAHPCVHCNPAWEEDENCYEHFVCSICGRHEEVKHPYCHCGAKMDGEMKEV